MVSVTVGSDPKVMRAHDVGVDTCSGYNIIAYSCLPHGWEQCVLNDSAVPNFVGAGKTPLALSKVESFANRFGKTV